MKLLFFKYQGTGNDFILIDNRVPNFPKDNTKLIARLCDRKFGIGADGLILLEEAEKADFKMVYFNADGHESSMCGNGGRCIVAFAARLGVIDKEARFMAIDGYHEARIEDRMIHLKMQDVVRIEVYEDHVFLDTGSPHHVQMETDLESLDIKKEGAALRYGKYGASGSNINFVTKESDHVFSVRTYERGVEDETLSCGTGVTAVALAMHKTKRSGSQRIKLYTPGGTLYVAFTESNGGYSDITLEGPATYVFKGEIIC